MIDSTSLSEVDRVDDDAKKTGQREVSRAPLFEKPVTTKPVFGWASRRIAIKYDHVGNELNKFEIYVLRTNGLVRVRRDTVYHHNKRCNGNVYYLFLQK